MVFSEIEPYADVIFYAFTGIVDDAYVNILSGSAEPSGLLAHQMPKDMDAVEADQEDVPRDLDCYVDSEGNTYDFCYGLNWSGVIDDDRTKTYKAAPVTKTEASWSRD